MSWVEFFKLIDKYKLISYWKASLCDQYSTRHSPYFLLFYRHPRLPEVMNACPMGDDFEVADPEDDIDTRFNKMKLLNETVCILWIVSDFVYVTLSTKPIL